MNGTTPPSARRATVTGAAGFIGGHLVSHLKQHGWWVRGVDTAAPVYRASDADEFLLLDLRDEPAARRAAASADVVFALAANMGGIGWTHAAPAEILHDNLLLSTHALESARYCGVSKVVLASSACVYPLSAQLRPDSPPLREDASDVVDPDREYGWEKLTAELLAASYRSHHGLDVTIARLHAVYGPVGTYRGLRAKSLAALCTKVAMLPPEGGEIEVWGDGTQTRSYCYVDDCVEGFRRLAESSIDVPVNIGSDQRVSIAELVGLISAVAGKEVRARYAPDRPVGPAGRCSDNTRCRSLLGWSPGTPLRVGLEATYGWIAQQVAHEAAGGDGQGARSGSRVDA